MIEALATGGLNVLLSCEVISEGFDVPVIQGIQMLRKTKSLSLYLQQVGRALRPKADGSKAIILDHVANTLEHGLPDAPRVWKLEGQARGSEDSPITCKECFRLFFKAADIADCTNAGCPAAQQKEAAEQQKAWDDAESARLLARWLATPRGLRTSRLVLADNSIGNEGAEALATALKTNASLRLLIFSGEHPGGHGHARARCRGSGLHARERPRVALAQRLLA